VQLTEWVEELKIHSYDVDFSKKASVESICRYFLEAAWNHAEALGFGFEQLAKNDKLWVLSRFIVSFASYPVWGDKVKLFTWPRPGTSLFAYRDFELLNSAGQPQVAGTSGWLIIDRRTRRPQRMADFLAALNLTSSRMAVSQPLEKLPEMPASAISEHCFTPKYSDFDLNQHVNSARYLGWILDSYSFQYHSSHCLSNLAVNYLGEIRREQQLRLVTYQAGPLDFYHSILDPVTEQSLFRARLQWQGTGPISKGDPQPNQPRNTSGY
jgi:medium-chain acyl-[acyl-carrier-protein] hydrolase